jgi:hypothetical protein
MLATRQSYFKNRNTRNRKNLIGNFKTVSVPVLTIKNMCKGRITIYVLHNLMDLLSLRCRIRERSR